MACLIFKRRRSLSRLRRMNLSPVKGLLLGNFLMIVGVFFFLLTLLNLPFYWIYILTGVILFLFGAGFFFPQIVNLDHIHNHIYSKKILSSLERCKSLSYLKILLSIKRLKFYKIQKEIDVNYIQGLVDAIYLAIEIYKENSEEI